MENAALILGFLAMFVIYSCAVYLLAIVVVTVARFVRRKYNQHKMKDYNHVRFP